MIFLIDWQWIWFKNYFKDIKSRISSRIARKIRKFLLFSKSFSVSIENHPCYPNKEKRIHFLFIAVIYFPLSIQMNISQIYYYCYVILTANMLDSALESSYNVVSNKSFITAMDTEIDSRYGRWYNHLDILQL